MQATKLTQKTVKENMKDVYKDNYSGHTRADGMVFNYSFTAERWDGMWEANIIMEDGEYSLTGSHKTLQGALQKVLKAL